MNGLFVNPDDRWTRRDWLIVLLSALVFGPIYLMWDEVYNLLLNVRVPGLNLATASLINGMWFMGGLVPMALIRKPGACLVGETLAALWEIVLAEWFGGYPIAYIGETYTSFYYKYLGQPVTAYPVMNVVFFVGILEGLGPEVMFALKRYRDFRLPTWLVAGGAGAVLEWMTGIWVTHYYYVDAIEKGNPWLLWGTLITSLIAIGLIAGSIGWWISHRAHGGNDLEPGPVEPVIVE